MNEFTNIVNRLISKAGEKFEEVYSPRITQITEKYLGRGNKVSQCSREQIEPLSLIVDELKDLEKQNI